jgi:hypothetical protein
MRVRSLSMSLLLLAAGLASSTAIGGCYANHPRGGFAWSAGEEPYYERWEAETHRDHRDYNQRGGDEQHEYQQWRQGHS